MPFWLKGKNAAQTVTINDPALRQVLESKRCGQCRRNCKLSAPMCRRGEKQAEIVIENYRKQCRP